MDEARLRPTAGAVAEDGKFYQVAKERNGRGQRLLCNTCSV
jgi:hypothetical protein